jgi:hypothetical protein
MVCTASALPVHRQAPTFLSHQFPATGIGATWWARPAQTELRAGRAGARLAAMVVAGATDVWPLGR